MRPCELAAGIRANLDPNRLSGMQLGQIRLIGGGNHPQAARIADRKQLVADVDDASDGGLAFQISPAGRSEDRYVVLLAVCASRAAGSSNGTRKMSKCARSFSSSLCAFSMAACAFRKSASAVSKS